MSTRRMVDPRQDLQQLIAQARIDLKRARRHDDLYQARRAEQRMNAMLDQLVRLLRKE